MFRRALPQGIRVFSERVVGGTCPRCTLTHTRRMPQNVSAGKGKCAVRQAICGRYLVRKLLLVLTASVMVVLLLAPTAAAQTYTQGRGSMHHPTFALTENASQPCSRPLRKTSDPSLATSFAPVALISVRQPCIHYLRRTGGPPLITTLLLGSLTVMVGSSVVIRALLRE